MGLYAYEREVNMNRTDFCVRASDNIADLFSYAVSEYNNDIAFIQGNEIKTYADVKHDVEHISRWINNFPIDNIVLEINNMYLFSVAYFAVVICGKVAILSSVNRYGNDELILNDSKVKIILEYTLDLCPINQCKVTPDKVCTVVQTSGTISDKKEVLLTHRNLATNCVAGLEKVEYVRGSRFLNLIPYTHVFGLVCELLAAFYSGCIICFCESNLHFFSSLKLYNPDYLNLPPAILSELCRMIKYKGKEFVVGTNLKRILCGGSKLAPSVVEELAHFGIIVLTCYGMSEAPGICINQEFNNNSSSVGKPVNCCSIIIADDGEILVSGTNVMNGYKNRSTQPFRYINGKRYLETGDIGIVDSEGFLYIQGRKDNLLIFQDGTKISAELYEDIINQIPGVIECVVRLSSIYTDVIIAEITVKEDAAIESIRQQIIHIGIDNHFIQNVRVVPFINKTLSGKVIRHD